MMASRILEESGQGRPPVSLESVLRVRLSSVTYAAKLPAEARIEEYEAGFLISLHESLRLLSKRRRRRFTIAHEIGHTLFYDLETRPPKRRIRLGFGDKFEERLCQDFAAKLLLPTPYMLEVLADFKESPENRRIATIQRICADCVVAVWPVVMRVMRDFDCWNSIVLNVRWSGKYGLFSEDKRTWRVLWASVPSSVRGLYLPTYARDPKRKAYPRFELEIFENFVGHSDAWEPIRWAVAANKLRLGNLSKYLRSNVREDPILWVTDLRRAMGAMAQTGFWNVPQEAVDLLVTIPLG